MKNHIEKILANIPNDSEEKMRYVEKIKQYSNECGCSWGANFVMASLGGVVVYLLYVDWTNESLIKVSLTILVFIFIGGGLGKLIGITIAKIKLQLLYKTLINKHKPQNT